MSDQQKSNDPEILRCYGEEAAYGFKELYAESHKVRGIDLTYIAIIILALVLAMNKSFLGGLLIIAAFILSLFIRPDPMFSTYDWTGNREYMHLADEFKKLYMEMRKAYHLNDYSSIERFKNCLEYLQVRKKEYPVGTGAVTKAKKAIEEDIDKEFAWFK